LRYVNIRSQRSPPLARLEQELTREAALDSRIGIRDIGYWADTVWLVANVEGTAVCVAALAYFSEENCHLDRLYVERSFRGRGIGASLVDAAKQFARRRDLYQLFVEVSGSNGDFWHRTLGTDSMEWIAPHLVEISLFDTLPDRPEPIAP